MAIWDPTTQTGYTQGTPRNWTTTIAAQTGTIRTATTSNVNTVISQCVPGDVVLLSNGNYGQITVNVSGTSTNKIVIVAANPGTYEARNVNVTAARIIINGAHIILGGFKYSWGTAQGNMIQLNGASIELTDCDIRDITVTSASLRVVVISGNANNAHIHHNLFRDISHCMLLAQDGTYPSPYATGVIIEYNKFQDQSGGVVGGTLGGYWVQLGNSPFNYASNHDLMTTGTVVRYNQVLRCFSAEIKTASNVVYRNWIKDSQNKAMGFRAGDNNRFEGNLVDNCNDGIRIFSKNQSIINNVFINNNGKAAILVSEGSLISQMGVIQNSQHERAEDILIANNVIIGGTNRGIHVGDTQTGRAGNPQPYSPKNVVIAGNIISRSVGVGIYVQNPDSVPAPSDGYSTSVDTYHKYVGLEIKNNTIYQTGGVVGDNPADGGSPSGYINWNHPTLTSGSVISGNIETNPLLTSTYRLLPTSPCINAGVAYSKNGYSTVTMSDWDGDARTIGAQPDMGVDEFGLNVHLPTVGTLFMLGGQVVSLATPYANFEMVPGQCALLFNGNFPLKGKSKTTETGTLYFNGGNSGTSLDPEGSVFYLNGGTLSGNFVWSAVASNTTTWRVL